MPITETSVLKLLGRSLAVAALAWSFSAGLHAQISALPQGMSGLGATAPDANAIPISPANALQLSNTLNAAKPAADQLAPELAPARLPLKPPAPNQFQRFVQESTEIGRASCRERV